MYIADMDISISRTTMPQTHEKDKAFTRSGSEERQGLLVAQGQMLPVCAEISTTASSSRVTMLDGDCSSPDIKEISWHES